METVVYNEEPEQTPTYSVNGDIVGINYEELYDELFSRAEQSVGAQLRPVETNN